MAKLLLVAMAAMVVSVYAQTPVATAVGCDIRKICGGPTRVAASVVIDPKNINGVMVNFFACECLNGTRSAVSADGTIVIPLPGAPSPPSPPARPPPPRFPPSRPDGFNPQYWAATLLSRYPTQCGAINITLLSSPISDPRGCQQTVKLGQRCWTNCKFAMRAVGEACYAVAIARDTADPSLVGSNTTAAFDQCTNNLAYTTLAEWRPSAAYLASAGTLSPSPAPASAGESPAAEGTSPEETSAPTAEAAGAPGPSSAASQITMSQVAAMLPLTLVVVALI